MPAYKRGQKIGTQWNYREAALGSAGNKGTFTDKDFGKPLKLVADSTYDLCADGDEIEEVLQALATQQSTVNGGYQIGTIRTTALPWRLPPALLPSAPSWLPAPTPHSVH